MSLIVPSFSPQKAQFYSITNYLMTLSVIYYYLIDLFNNSMLLCTSRFKQHAKAINKALIKNKLCK